MNILRTVDGTAAVVALLCTTPLLADSVSAPMTVSVQVIARAIVAVDSQPAVVDVTPDDIARGYVDVTTPIMLRVRTNSRRGYMLQAEKTSEAFSSIDLSLPTASMQVSSRESWIQRPYVSGGDLVPVQARLILSPNAAPGSYALPVAFSASPL